MRNLGLERGNEVSSMLGEKEEVKFGLQGCADYVGGLDWMGEQGEYLLGELSFRSKGADGSTEKR